MTRELIFPSTEYVSAPSTCFAMLAISTTHFNHCTRKRFLYPSILKESIRQSIGCTQIWGLWLKTSQMLIFRIKVTSMDLVRTNLTRQLIQVWSTCSQLRALATIQWNKVLSCRVTKVNSIRSMGHFSTLKKLQTTKRI